MINENWPRWILASCIKHFNDQKGSYNFWAEGMQTNKKDWDLWCEFYLFGPRILEASRNYYVIECDIQLCLSEIPNNIDIYRLQKIVGYFATLMTTIPVYRYGRTADDIENDGELLDCMILQDKIDIANFGSPSPGTKLLQSTITAT